MAAARTRVPAPPASLHRPTEKPVFARTNRGDRASRSGLRRQGIQNAARSRRNGGQLSESTRDCRFHQGRTILLAPGRCALDACIAWCRTQPIHSPAEPGRRRFSEAWICQSPCAPGDQRFLRKLHEGGPMPARAVPDSSLKSSRRRESCGRPKHRVGCCCRGLEDKNSERRNGRGNECRHSKIPQKCNFSAPARVEPRHGARRCREDYRPAETEGAWASCSGCQKYMDRKPQQQRATGLSPNELKRCDRMDAGLNALKEHTCAIIVVRYNERLSARRRGLEDNPCTLIDLLSLLASRRSLLACAVRNSLLAAVTAERRTRSEQRKKNRRERSGGLPKVSICSTYPHSENPQTWHLAHPSACSICDPQSGHVPIND